VKHFLYNERFFSGIIGEFTLQTPKYFMKPSMEIWHIKRPGARVGAGEIKIAEGAK
jgi:hypothetical protein